MTFSRLIGTSTVTVLSFGLAATASAQTKTMPAAQGPSKTLPAAQAPAAPSKTWPAAQCPPHLSRVGQPPALLSRPASAEQVLSGRNCACLDRSSADQVLSGR